MKFKMLKATGQADYPWSLPVRQLFEAPTAEDAEKKARRTILWLQPSDVLKMEPVSGDAVSLGAQLWEPCRKCGAEPSYAQPGGHLCARCAQTDHPKLCAGSEPENTMEPEGGR